MTNAQRIGVAAFYACVAAFLLFVAYDAGRWRGRSAAIEERRDACICGSTQTCAFGDGVVGMQTCLTSYDKNEWSRCEPDPRWRTP